MRGRIRDITGSRDGLWLGLAASALVIGAAAGTALGVLTLAGVTFQGSEQSPDRKEGLLLTANRDRLAICVQAVGIDPVMQTEAKTRIEELLPELEKHRNWVLARLDVAPPVVDAGCPSDPALLRPGADVKFGAADSSSVVKEASQHRLFVFILPQSEIERLFAGWPYRRVPQELVCEGHQCGEVTTAIYLSLEELQSESFLKESLVKGIGLEPAVPFDSAIATEGPGSQLVGGPLHTANRDRLAICVDAIGIDTDIEGTAKTGIEDALKDVANHPFWDDAGLDQQSPVVHIGCPQPPVVFQPGVEIISLGEKGIHVEPGRVVSEASYYRVFVYIISPGELERIFHGGPPEATEESFRRGDNITGVTLGLYLTQDQLQSPEYLVRWLTKAVGLEAATD